MPVAQVVGVVGSAGQEIEVAEVAGRARDIWDVGTAVLPSTLNPTCFLLPARYETVRWIDNILSVGDPQAPSSLSRAGRQS